MQQPAIFLDRDGTVNVEVNYLHQPELVQLEATVGAAIARLNAAGWPVIVITNQSGIARGYYTSTELHAVNQRINALLKPFAARVDAWYWCPHHPDVTGPCACRKPGTALFEQAASEHCIDLRNSWMIGDKLLDVQAGLNAGCHAIMVTTGYGADQHAQAPPDVAVVPSLAAAVDVIFAAQ